MDGFTELYILDPVLSSEPMLKHDFHKALESSKFPDPDTKEEITGQITGFVTCKPKTIDVMKKCFHPDDPNVHPETDPSENFKSELRLLLKW